MKCQDIGWIQAYLDGELNREERKEYIQHLDQCKACQQMLEEANKLNQWEKVALGDALSNAPQEMDINVDQAWQAFERKLQQNQKVLHNTDQKKGRWHDMKKSSKRWVVATAAAAVVCVSLTIPQVRVGASNFLSVFRVNDVQLVKLTESDMQDIRIWLSGTEDGTKSLKGIGKIEVKDSDNKKDTHFNSEQQAKDAGYAVPKVPSGYVVESVHVSPSFTMQFELNTEQANKLLKQIQSSVQFDNALNGKKFSIMVPESTSTHITGDKKQAFGNFSYNVIDAPQISVPEGVDVKKLQKTVLELPIIPENVKTQLAGIQDWTKTLPIPYMAKDAKSSETQVQGVKAALYEEERDSVLVWEKEGKLHMLQEYGKPGTNKNTSNLIKLANEIK
ncbi:anti-sigma factor family protein [Microbacteriaceae bacterium 4G12]